MQPAGEGFGTAQDAVPICAAVGAEHDRGGDPRPSAIPPAATTGTSTASTTCGTSAIVPTWVARSAVRNMPRCPPASMPCAMTASQPWSSSHRASATLVALDMTLAPVARTRSTSGAGGQTEVEADDGRRELLDDLGHRRVERHPRRRHRSLGVDLQLAVIGGESRRGTPAGAPGRPPARCGRRS